MMYRVPLIFTPQPEGGYTVTSPLLPELLTEGDSLEESAGQCPRRVAAVSELYAEQGRALPASIFLPASGGVVWSELPWAAHEVPRCRSEAGGTGMW